MNRPGEAPEENPEAWERYANELERERDEVVDRMRHLARAWKLKAGAEWEKKAAEILESLMAYPVAGRPVIEIVAESRDAAEAKLAGALEALRGLVKAYEEGGVWFCDDCNCSHEDASLAAALAAARAALGEGHP